MKSLFVLMIVVAACVSSSSAIRCYSCTFPGDTKCQDPGSELASDCGEPGFAEKALGAKPVCLKTVNDIQGNKVITRSCSLQGGTINACSLKGVSEHCSVCETDLCNGSGRLLIGIWTLIPVAIAMFIKFL